MPVTKALETLKNALATDAEYFHTWKTAIMTEFCQSYYNDPSEEGIRTRQVSTISEEAAINFLNHLINGHK